MACTFPKAAKVMTTVVVGEMTNGSMWYTLGDLLSEDYDLRCRL